MDLRKWLIIALTIPCLTGYPTELGSENFYTDIGEYDAISFLSRNLTTDLSPYGFSRVKRQSVRGNCKKGQFECKDKSCIPVNNKCDGKRDCADGTDETTSACKGKTCASYLFRCNYGACVDEDARCNKVQDCADNSDEIGCPGSPTTAPTISNCRKSEFTCKNGNCISKDKLCDGKADCSDVSDETVAACSKKKCASYLFTCAYGACIEDSLKCNHVSDCFDSSDEWISLCGEGFVDPSTDVPITITTTTLRTTVSGSTTTCIIPERPENGYYSILTPNRIPTPGEVISTGTALEYRCKNKNYTLDGQSIIKCHDGDWNPVAPECKKLCLHVQSVTSTATCQYNGKPTVCSLLLKHGTVVKHACKAKHYSRDFIRSRTCIDGAYDFPLPKCIPECGEESGEGAGLILGGYKARNGTFPWHVGIYSNLKQDLGLYVQSCGGSIIRTNIVVSAAHCFYNEDTSKAYDTFFYRVAAGKFYRALEDPIDEKSPYVQYSMITTIIMPEQYGGNAQQHQSDIALLVLQESFNFSQFVVAVCIDLIDDRFDKDQLSSNNIGKAVGWGVTSEGGSASEYLKAVDLPAILYNECKNKLPESFRRYLTSDKYCAGYLNGTSVCSGDSGGGMVFKTNDSGRVRWYLRGIVSVGVPSSRSAELTCRNDTYSAFTRVFSHGNWILEKLSEYD